MNKFSDYKKAIEVLFGNVNGWREIGGYINKNGIRTPAITISNKLELPDGSESYKVVFNKKVLDKLVQDEGKNG